MGADRVSSFLWLAFGVLCMYGSVLLGLGTLRQPGSGFFPFLCGGFFTSLALMVFVRSLIPGRGFQSKISSLWKGTLWHRPLAVGILMAGYILALERIGFFLTSLVVLLIMLRGVEKYSWWKALLISILSSGSTYLLFQVLLKTSLPTGVFGF
jgi:putative tricarboxylic transport membrane protein